MGVLNSGRPRLSPLLLVGLVIPVGIGLAISQQWMQNESPVEYSDEQEWELVAKFTIAGEEYQLKQPVSNSFFVPNHADLLLAVTDADDKVLFTQAVPGHRFGFPTPMVEIGEDPILVLNYADVGFIDCTRLSETTEITGTRLRYRITPTALERLENERYVTSVMAHSERRAN